MKRCPQILSEQGAFPRTACAGLSNCQIFILYCNGAAFLALDKMHGATLYSYMGHF
jgi:hypothetical protein